MLGGIIRPPGPGHTARVLKTGQTTQYNSKLDDGYYQKGIAKAYSVLTTGQYSGTTNIDLAHYTGVAGNIAFDNGAKTITDSGNGLAIFKTNDVILTDTPNNLGPFTITTGNVAGTITCTGATFVTETPAGAVTIYKREAHSNNCVLDLKTGLMWSRYQFTKMGAASDGRLPWYDATKIFDVFTCCAAANVANLSGYSDWRVPNVFELLSVMSNAAPNSAPDATAFPSFNIVAGNWSSSTMPSATANADLVYFINGNILQQVKTNGLLLTLVRGGN